MQEQRLLKLWPQIKHESKRTKLPADRKHTCHGLSDSRGSLTLLKHTALDKDSSGLIKTWYTDLDLIVGFVLVFIGGGLFISPFLGYFLLLSFPLFVFEKGSYSVALAGLELPT